VVYHDPYDIRIGSSLVVILVYPRLPLNSRSSVMLKP